MQYLKAHMRLCLPLCALWACSDADTPLVNIKGVDAGRDGAMSADAAGDAALGLDMRADFLLHAADLGADSGPDASGEVISCGEESCEVGRQICCADAFGMALGCIDASDVCEGSVLICDGPEDCPGGYCCAVVTFEASILERTADVGGETGCTPDCNFSFDYNPVTGRGEITARACHTSMDCPATEPVCCEVPGMATGTCLTESAAMLVEEYTYGLMDCG